MPTNVSKKDFNLIAHYVVDEYERRKKSREDKDRAWKDIDRQIEMTPECSHKLDAAGNPDPNKAWMPETELPLQAECLEVLTADARRMQFPDSGDWFAAHACLTDDYIEFMESQSIIAGELNETPSIYTQDNIDKLAQGVIAHWHRQYDFYGNMDIINAEAFKYGMGVGRTRLVRKNVFLPTAKGIVKQVQEIPVLFPVSIKNTYLDDREFSLMGEGQMLGASDIFYKKQSIEDLKLAAKGSNDPESMNGGWVSNGLKGLKGDKNGIVEIYEIEGDLVIPKSQGAIVSPSTIITVAKGDGLKVIRVRFNKGAQSSYIRFPYHVEGMDSAYPTSPLMKGWPIQKAAVDALNRLLMVAALNAQPPIGYDKDDADFARSGGPLIFPGAQWPTLGDVKPHMIGEPGVMQAIYLAFLQQYADVTGINAPRLGAQTISHTTAYSKQVELNRGTVRTVDYVRNSLQGPLEQLLYKEYEIGRQAWTKKQKLYIDAYNGFVEVERMHLPTDVTWKAHGAGGPEEDKIKNDRRFGALMQAVQLDQLAIQQGRQPTIDIPSAIEALLRSGGWTDTDPLKVQQQLQNEPIGETSPGAALQALAMNAQ